MQQIAPTSLKPWQKRERAAISPAACFSDILFLQKKVLELAMLFDFL